MQTEALNDYTDDPRMLHSIPLSDGLMPSAIQQLAQLGTWGQHTVNVDKKLKHLLGEPTLPKPMMATVPMATPKPTTGEDPS